MRPGALVLAAGALGALAGIGSAEVAAAPGPRPGDRLFPLSRAGLPHCATREVQAHAPGVWISLGCRRLGRERLRVVERPVHGSLGRVSQRRDGVRYRPRAGFEGTDRFVVARRRGRRAWRTAVLVNVVRPEAVAGAARSPSCTSRHVVSPFRAAARVRITCRGSGLGRLRVVAGPFSANLAAVRRSGNSMRRTLRARLKPAGAFVGEDVLLVEVSGTGGNDVGAASTSTLPWRMRALGDSVTAGFGYYGNGKPMSPVSLVFCKPGSVVTNRCSSNSDEGPGYSGPPEWSADYGLANNISWAAQFANGIQGGGNVAAPDMFQNLAVTGSAPSDWLPGGLLDDELDAIVAENPELIAFTMGANPLLTDILLTGGGERCAFTETVAALETCIQPFFDQVHLTSRLQQFYTALLRAPDSTLVTFQYHLAIPSANLFAVWQLEAIGDYFNAQIATAVANTKAALPQKAGRLILVQAQTDPGSPNPQQLPRFNIGLPPALGLQPWSPPYDCGDGDLVDGPSHQSEPTQGEFRLGHPFTYCPGDEWVIGADSGIHPSSDGYAAFAQALANVAAAHELIPPLP
jgi:lysophospholipase L1-like esterase